MKQSIKLQNLYSPSDIVSNSSMRWKTAFVLVFTVSQAVSVCFDVADLKGSTVAWLCKCFMVVVLNSHCKIVSGIITPLIHLVS